MQAPERMSNSQPWSGQTTISPSTQPSHRLPPWCGHSLSMARISSPRRNTATSRPFTVPGTPFPGGRSARSSTLTRATGCRRLPGPGRAAWARRLRVIGLVQELDDVKYLDRRALGPEALGDLDDAAGVGGHHRVG